MTSNSFPEKKKAVVLLSGGLDSTANLYAATKEYDVVLALTFNYGQRAYLKEHAAAQFFCQDLGVESKTIDITWFDHFTSTSLVDTSQEIPCDQDVDMDSVDQSKQTAKAVWVPNRNGIFLNIAAGFAEGLGADYVIPGFNLEEAQTFPDNSEDFLLSLNQSFSFSTANRVEVKCFTTDLNKQQIVQLARKHKVDLDRIWPCYENGESWCGRCESCQRTLRALNFP